MVHDTHAWHLEVCKVGGLAPEVGVILLLLKSDALQQQRQRVLSAGLAGRCAGSSDAGCGCDTSARHLRS